jgi:hypothetical protein
MNIELTKELKESLAALFFDALYENFYITRKDNSQIYTLDSVDWDIVVYHLSDIDLIKQVTADLIKERDELKAHCDFLTYAFNRCYSCVPDDGSFVSNECFQEFSDKLLQTPQQSLADLIKERDELKAHCGKLFGLVNDLDSYLDTNEFTSISHGSIFHQQMKHLITFAPQQSLNEIKAQAIEAAIEVLPAWIDEDCDPAIKVDDLSNYAKKLREQAK